MWSMFLATRDDVLCMRYRQRLVCRKMILVRAAELKPLKSWSGYRILEKGCIHVHIYTAFRGPLKGSGTAIIFWLSNNQRRNILTS